MKIITNRLNLTEVAWEDLEEIHQLHSIPEVDEFNTLGLPNDMDETRDKIKPFIEAVNNSPQNKYTWALRLNDTNEFIGLAGISLSNDRFKIGEIFYKLNPKYWGNGYATEVSKKIIEVGFTTFKLHRIVAGAATENVKSIRVLEKCGMIREGVLRKILPIRGEWIDSCFYSIIEDEYQN